MLQSQGGVIPNSRKMKSEAAAIDSGEESGAAEELSNASLYFPYNKDSTSSSKHLGFRGTIDEFKPFTKETTPMTKVSPVASMLGHGDSHDSMKSFLTSPCPMEAGTVACYVKRHKNAICPEYRIYLKHGDVFLMTSKKRRNKKTSNYLISMARNDYEKTSENIIGKLRANFLGTEFQIYDAGRNPKDKDPFFDEINDDAIRSELGAVLYANNLVGNKGPRRMTVCIPKVGDNDRTTKVWQPSHQDEEMIACFKDRMPSALHHLFLLENKEPTWNEEMRAHVLNFKGRVTHASVKNFQMVGMPTRPIVGKRRQNHNHGDGDNDEDVLLQFGRVGKDEFTLDFSWPISPLQAFAIALSSCDSKISCN